MTVGEAMVSRRPVACEAAVAHREPVACKTAVANRDPPACETVAIKAAASAAKAMASATVAYTAAPREGDRSGRHCRYAEQYGRCCCNHLLARCSNLLIFRLKWIAPA
jgi:hypothetical protein